MSEYPDQGQIQIDPPGGRCPVNPHFWRLPAFIVSGGLALGLLGTVAINYATYAALPARADAADARAEELAEVDEEQDKRFDQYLQQQELDRAEAKGYKEALKGLTEQLTQQVNHQNARNVAVPRTQSRQRKQVVELETFIDYNEETGQCWICQAKEEPDCWVEDDEGHNLWRECG